MSYCKRVGMTRNNKSNIVKGQWTLEEDRLLISLVEQYGLRKWTDIAQKLPGRMGKQCRERWINHLRPDIKKDIWSEEEEKILMKAHEELGNKWVKIAKRLPGRTENSIKNHWYATKRREYSKRNYPSGSTLLQEYIKSLNLDKNPPKENTRKSSTKASDSECLLTNQSTISAQSQSQKGSDSECLLSSGDFDDDILNICFDDNMFQDGCSIDSLLDDMQIVEDTMLGVDVKKELDLIEFFYSGQ